MKIDKEIPQVLVWTGQHFDKEMKELIQSELGLPEFDWDCEDTTFGGMVESCMSILEKEKPAYVMVYGDTRSTLAGALAAHQVGIPLIHVEAGMRSHNSKMVEERNRILIDHMSEILFCPCKSAVDNLKNEGIKYKQIYNVGCTQFSAVFSTFPTKKPKDAYKYVLATIHRASNTDEVDNLRNIIEALNTCDYKVIFPVHPRTRKVIEDYDIKVGKNVKMVAPMPYTDFVHKMAFAKCVVTDSGGVQPEAYFLRRPCVTCRYETEWQETVTEGWNVLVGTDTEKIRNAINTFDVSVAKHQSCCYGTGNAKQMVRSILETL